MNKTVHRISSFILLLLFYTAVLIQPVAADEAIPYKSQAAVASAHPLATQAGLDIMREGGNAFDAAVAVSAALAVVEPYSSGIGGGGFYLLHKVQQSKDSSGKTDDIDRPASKRGRYIMVDARERAPLRSHADMYLDDAGDVISNASINGALSAGIPGSPAAMVHLAEKYGELTLAQSLAPAIRYAREGFPVDAHYQRMATFRRDAFLQNDAASSIFLKDGEVPELETLIIQADLADTLELIATSGHAGFYEGELALNMVKDVRKHGGIWTMKDLGTYEIKERAPEVTIYKGMKVVAASLPSSGGLVISEILNMLSHYELNKMDEVQQIHVIVEAMRRAYRDRAEYMGDPDYIEVPVDRLVSAQHTRQLLETLSLESATPSDSLKAVAQPSGDGTDTTHFSVIDKQGNKVSATLSINYPFGSCFVPRGTGVLLNDEMDDFVSKPGVPNVYGLVGSHANAIEPGKRMLSSMTPSIIETRDEVAIIGTPGGSRIITMVLLGMIGFYDGLTADEIVNTGRFHHQYLPDEISYEPGALDEELVSALEALGHNTREMDYEYGNMQLIIVDKQSGEIDAASDGRGVGSAEVLH
jgi:gamma-glutamyltranspeptidase/glutathione hydrolase